MSVADWLGRTLFLILSGLATFALIQAIASLASTAPAGPAALPDGNRVSMPVPSSPESPPPTDLSDRRAASLADATPSGSAPAAAPVSDPALDRIARLLETLTYAVLALTGFVAAGVLVLLRLTANKR